MKSRILLDTGPLVAFLNARDAHHDWAVGALADVRPPLLTSEAILSEACFLTRRLAGGSAAVVQLLRRGLIEIPFALQSEVDAVARLMAKYAEIPMSLADASLVRMVETDVGTAVMTLDRDFRVYRMHSRKAIPTIMPDA